MSNTDNFVTINGVEYYKIENYDNLKPFFIVVPSSNDIWIFVSSNGGVTAGRKNSSGNMFPYVTDDKLAVDYETGSKTVIRVEDKLWQPFQQSLTLNYNVTRNIYKSCYANSVIFEEINHDLELTYSYKYESSEKYGFIKSSLIKNQGSKVKVEVIDGLNNIMPYGVNDSLQANSSTLADAYKAAELVGDNLALYSLTAHINDTPNAQEMLKCNVAYNTLNCKDVYLTPDAIKAFADENLEDLNRDSYGTKSAYYITYSKEFGQDEEIKYSFVLDNGYNHCDLETLYKYVEIGDFKEVFSDIEKGTNDIIEIVRKADGIQDTNDKVACATHYLNTLYNCMRGGVFSEGYNFDYNDFIKFVEIRNKKALENSNVLSKIVNCKTIIELKETAKEDKTIYRLALEYMPLTFSRRHGDPSRPWNKFNIEIKGENGEKVINYEGNWRDIFQNWEALGYSYPCYFENMVTKFVNASTFDGYNPYRINKKGIDWEKPEPENPFGGLGYWGDHQVIYLLRILEGLNKHFPNRIKQMLNFDNFSYANVPYVIADYDSILKDSKNTIYFDVEKDCQIEELEKTFGSDARLVLKNEEVLTVTLAEKLLVVLLSKLSNLLVGGGIWMNTQRPEWNDANNSIVGIGLSMVTVYHLSAYLDFLKNNFSTESDEFYISENVYKWLLDIKSTLEKYDNNYKGNEKVLLDIMGYSFSQYRNNYYKNGMSNKVLVNNQVIQNLIKSAKNAVNYTILENKTTTYSSYNLLNDDFSVSPMKMMLEGQSSIIGSGLLSAVEVCNLVESMKDELYSEKLKCHTLYPIKMTKKFYDKNKFSLDIEPITGIVNRDINGSLHFDSDIITQKVLTEKLEEKNISSDICKCLIDEFERQFSHNKFNGRSEVMYKFEGIGCVYWHQNAKFLLAILETVQREKEKGNDITNIYELYNELLQGFIYRKSPKECGTIPIEPYSHTSFNGKSEQPGMTGQVKESVLMRRGELGVIVKNGQILFDGTFIREDEFNENGTINFTICSIPISYIKSTENKMVLEFSDGSIKTSQKHEISVEDSKKIFEKNSDITSVKLYIL